MQICKQFTKNFFYFFIFFVTFFFINEINAQNDTLAVKKIEKKNNHSVATE